MDIKEFENYCLQTSERIADLYLQSYDLEKRILHATAKASEEFGELSEAVLKKLQSQRAVKLNDFKMEHLEDEVADSLIVVGIIASLTGVDVEKALRNKINKLEKRDKVTKEAEIV